MMKDGTSEKQMQLIRKNGVGKKQVAIYDEDENKSNSNGLGR